MLNFNDWKKKNDKNSTDYYVESPKGIKGWIEKEHVKSISMKNPKTLALCQ